MTYSIKTYRYLRMAMVAMIVLLGAAVLIEWAKTDPRCLQTSISAYYYTPVRAIFVGALITIGVCMVVLKGNTETEDILLNVAGILAPAVALVPTPGQGRCHSVPVVLGDAAANVSNNMLALFVVGVPCLLLTAFFIVRDRRRQPAGWTPLYVVGLGVAVLIFGGGLAWFLLDRSGFIGHAHYAAAIVMFACIVVVVLVNAEQYRRKHADPRSPANRYSVIAIAMVVVPLLMVAWKKLFGWEHAVLGIEAALILLFAAFWVSQTEELWNEGLRQELPRSPQASPSPLRSSADE
jgi:heme A synthase